MTTLDKLYEKELESLIAERERPSLSQLDKAKLEDMSINKCKIEPI
jgi:hypothetical protein